VRGVRRVGEWLVQSLVEVNGEEIPLEEAPAEARRGVALAIYRGAAEVLAPAGVKVNVRLAGGVRELAGVSG
jgi:hypothetical protein